MAAAHSRILAPYMALSDKVHRKLATIFAAAKPVPQLASIENKLDGLISLIGNDRVPVEKPEPRNPFWYYQCSFDAIDTMKKFAAPKLTPSPGYYMNYLGVKIDPAFAPHLLHGLENTIEPMPQPNNWHADIAEFAAALRAVDLAGETFTAVELGCGWACWLNNTGAAARMSGRKVHLLGVEGDPGHVEFARRSLGDNGFDASEVSIYHGIAGVAEGVALFPKQATPGAQWGLAPIFGATKTQLEAARTTNSHEVLNIISLAKVIAQVKFVDLLHIDIQGGEAGFLEAAQELCKESVRYIFVGTHSRSIEGKIEELMLKNGWSLEMDRPAISSLESGVQTLRVDGVQGWRNMSLS